MTKSETAKLLAVIASVYSQFEVTAFKQNIWHELLKELDYNHASTALKELLKESSFPPSPADIIKKGRVEKFMETGTHRYNWIEGGAKSELTRDKGIIKCDPRCIPKVSGE